MRLFYALDFDPAAKGRLLAARDALRGASEGGSFTRPENLHLTLAFVGEVSDETPYKKALAALPDEAPRLTFGPVVPFGREGLYVVKADGCEALSAFRSRLAEYLEETGLAYDNKRFLAHVTLGREVIFRPGTECSAFLPAPFEGAGTRAALFLSHRVNGRLVYTPLAEKALASR